MIRAVKEERYGKQKHLQFSSVAGNVSILHTFLPHTHTLRYTAETSQNECRTGDGMDYDVHTYCVEKFHFDLIRINLEFFCTRIICRGPNNVLVIKFTKRKLYRNYTRTYRSSVLETSKHWRILDSHCFQLIYLGETGWHRVGGLPVL